MIVREVGGIKLSDINKRDLDTDKEKTMNHEHYLSEIRHLRENWNTDKRWRGVQRTYAAEEVVRLRGSIQIEHTFARMGAERFWQLMQTEPYIHALGALTGTQAVQMVQAGLQAIYVSGWQVAADNNLSWQTYPDQSLYPVDSVPALVRRINAALQRADQIQYADGNQDTYWFAPIVADAESGFGGTLNAFELMKAMIEAGAAAVHFEDQLSSQKKCGHMGGKVLVPARDFIQKLIAARLAADIMGVPTVIIARTDAQSAHLVRADYDPVDQPFLTGERSVEGFFYMEGGIDAAIARGIAYAPYSDMIWCETSDPNLEDARRFAEGVHARFPGKLLAYNCSPSFNWKRKLDDAAIAKFQRELGAMGYKFQFVTLAGFHAVNHSMFELAQGYKETGMTAYVQLQEKEFASERDSQYAAVKNQKFVGTGYFDEIAQTIAGGAISTTALAGSTETEQFVETKAA
jgi:isocitrate lyase